MEKQYKKTDGKTSKEDLKKINKEHFKNRPNSVNFCSECNSEQKTYCGMCANKQLNRLGN